MPSKIIAVFGNMVTVGLEESVTQNAVAFCCREDGRKLLSEVIRVRGHNADLQVFEETRGLKVGDAVEFSDDMLSVDLGPGLLGSTYDGLQNPLHKVADQEGFFLTPGVYMDALDQEAKWEFTPVVEKGATVRGGIALGTVPEGIFEHQIMAPFTLRGEWTVESIAKKGSYTVKDEIATLKGPDGQSCSATLQQKWPVKIPLSVCRRRLMPTDPLVTQVRIIDSMFPIVRGGTYCIPGPFGAGKTVLQQITSRNAEVDVVVVAACGERAGEVVETIREFPKIDDPRTGRSLMERTIIICNTSAMPVAAREASVYTAATLAEYYRQMGLQVLLLADSTSRWAQAMREISGRLEEIPGEEAFPAYLESRIAGFYERAGALELHTGKIGSLTIGGTVSPAGGNFEEPVTQSTLKVVGAFHGLSRDRADARRYPAIDPLESWSKYTGVIESAKVAQVRALLSRGNEIKQMMAVVGEEGTSIEDIAIMQKAEFFDHIYLQQNAFDDVDGSSSAERQQYVFDKILRVVDLEFEFADRDEAHKAFARLADLFRNWNYAATGTDEYKQYESEIDKFLETGGKDAEPQPAGATAEGEKE